MWEPPARRRLGARACGRAGVDSVRLRAVWLQAAWDIWEGKAPGARRAGGSGAWAGLAGRAVRSGIPSFRASARAEP